MTNTKKCTACNEEKPLSAYYREKNGKYGVRSKCIPCLTNGRPPGPIPVSPLEKYVVDKNGCWLWCGKKDQSKHKYGNLKFEGRFYQAHHWFYLKFVGPILPGSVIDHGCNVKTCVNPDHLEQVTQSVNLQRAWDGRHCSSCSCFLEGTPKKDSTKRCSRCLWDLPKRDFYIDSSSEDHRREWCKECYKQISLGGVHSRDIPLLERYAPFGECWIWLGHHNNKYYGDMYHPETHQRVLAHRYFYSIYNEPLKENMVIDHLCNVRPCVNPAHLKQVTFQDNIQREWDSRHCDGCSCEVVPEAS